jgi:hypothetical protein
MLKAYEAHACGFMGYAWPWRAVWAMWAAEEVGGHVYYEVAAECAQPTHEEELNPGCTGRHREQRHSQRYHQFLTKMSAKHTHSYRWP